MNIHFDIYGLITTTVKSLPYVSEGIPAGFPSPAADYIGDRIDLNEVLILSPGATYYARVRDYYLVEEELEQGDGILFDTRLAPRTGDLAFCEVCGERVLKYIRKRGRELWLLGGGTDDTLPVDGDTEARVLGVVTVVIKVRRFKRRRTRLIDRLPQKEQPALFERRAIRASYFPASDVPVAGLVDLNEELIPNPISTFFGKVRGISLIEDDIEDSDSVIVDRMLEPRWGDLAVCVTSEGFTMKYVEVHDDGEIWLMPGLVRQIFFVSGALLIPQHGYGVGFGGMGLGKRPDQRQPIKIRPGHPKIEIPVSGHGVIQPAQTYCVTEPQKG